MADRTVHRSLDLDAPPDDVWDLIVDDDERASWFGGETELDPTPGGRGWFREPDGTRRDAVVEEAEPGRRLSWTWSTPDGDDETGPSRVTITLAPTPGGTRLDLTEASVARGARASALASTTGPLLDLELVVLLRCHLAVAVAR